MVVNWIWGIATVVSFWASMQSDLRVILQRGIDLYYGAKYQEAIKTLSEAESKISKDTPKKDSVETKLFLGVSYYAAGNIDEAKSHFMDIYRIDPEYVSVPFKIEIIELISNARTDYLELERACSSTCASLSAAIANRDVEQISAAVKSLTHQCDCAGGRSKAALAIFDIAQGRVNDGQYEQAQAYFATAAQLDPALQSKVARFGRLVVSATNVGGRLLIDDRPVTELQMNAPSPAILLSAADHVVKLLPTAVEFKEYATSVTVDEGQTKAVQLSPERKADELRSISLKSGDLLDLDAGKISKEGADLMWYAATGILVPQGKATVVLLPQSAFFESTNVDELKALASQSLPPTAINRRLESGRVIAVRTGEGAYAKVRIESVGDSLNIRWVIYPR